MNTYTRSNCECRKLGRACLKCLPNISYLEVAREECARRAAETADRRAS